jgi:protocatechuate 3,4-dioxygenase alpha subunit
MADTAPQTPSQTLGPYFSMIVAHDDEDAVLADAHTPGDPIVLVGTVLDGAREPIEDALVELWQADAAGRYRHPLDDDRPLEDPPGFTGFGRAKSAFEDGGYRFRSIRPGPVPAPGGGSQAPHLNLCVQGRGMLNPVFTRVYFPEEVEANLADPVLSAVPEARRSTLIATRQDASADEDVATYRFDVLFQGDDETVFLDV